MCAIRFYLPQVCPLASPFVFSVLFIPSFNVLSGYFCVSLSLVAVPTVRIFDKIHDTAPLTSFTLIEIFISVPLHVRLLSLISDFL